MSNYPDTIEELIIFLKQLPGIGRRGAERLTLHILQWEKDKIMDFANSIANLAAKTDKCPQCGAWAKKDEFCNICQDPRRDPTLLCVVESMQQLMAVENGGNYRGRYLVLGGRLSPLDGENGDGLNFELLKKLAFSGEVKEVILALSSDVEGRATAAYLAEMLQDAPVELSKPALGLPAGANLSFADSATISAAFNGRSKY